MVWWVRCGEVQTQVHILCTASMDGMGWFGSNGLEFFDGCPAHAHSSADEMVEGS